MAILGVSSQGGRLFCPHDPSTDARLHLAKAVAGLPAHAPIVIMLHGYRYHPHFSNHNPHKLLFHGTRSAACRKSISWPSGLGFSEFDRSNGLAIGFAWEGRCTIKRKGYARLNPFLPVYHQATRSAGHLARLLRWLGEVAPDHTVDIFAHSLGARVALKALTRDKDDNIGRVILMGAAEYTSVATNTLAKLSANTRIEVFNIIAAENRFFDLLFESLAPRTHHSNRSIGRGLDKPMNNWLDLCLDDQTTLNALSARGVGLPVGKSRINHWGFYTRPGMFFLYTQLIRNRALWRMADLRNDITMQNLPTVHPALRPDQMDNFQPAK